MSNGGIGNWDWSQKIDQLISKGMLIFYCFTSSNYLSTCQKVKKITILDSWRLYRLKKKADGNSSYGSSAVHHLARLGLSVTVNF